MAIGLAFLVVATLIVVVWLFIEFKRLKHKFFAFFLIGLILFTYISFSVSLSNQDVDLTSASGLMDAGKLYLSWLSSIFVKMKGITTYALKMNWGDYDQDVLNQTSGIEEESEGIWDRLK